LRNRILQHQLVARNDAAFAKMAFEQYNYNIIQPEIIDDNAEDTLPNSNYIALMHLQNVLPVKAYKIM